MGVYLSAFFRIPGKNNLLVKCSFYSRDKLAAIPCQVYITTFLNSFFRKCIKIYNLLGLELSQANPISIKITNKLITSIFSDIF